jgi:putative membrane-bound dehydrogenase-like protein
MAQPPDMRAELRRALCGALVLLPVAAACHRGVPPFSPDAARKTFQLEAGYSIELVAAEPQVASPVALDFDEDGRLFVVEMPGYPLDTGPTGRVRLLEDRDGDGRYERSSVFADGLVLPTGVMRYRKGVLVTAAPDVFYLEDADGDGKAEKREKVLTGFAFSNPQHTVNSPVFGLDNWIHLAHEGPAGAVIYPQLFGDRGSPLRFPDKAGSPELAVGRHAVRFRPDTFEIEARSGSSQFGHAFDEWGRYLTLDNSNHARHEVIAARYLKRNPALAAAGAMQNASDHGSNAKVYAVTRNPRFELLTEPGEFTSACGMALDTGGLFSRPGARSGFVAEPAQNLVHRDLWSDRGSTFVARRAQEEREFLASTDSWFRPVYLAIGPDASLYLVDYYRQMIEHPEWASTHVHRHEERMYAGQDLGRIWRLWPTDVPSATRARPRLGAASDEELVKALANEQGWWRRTAQRLLVDGRRTGAVPLLVRLFTESSSPLGRLHALWALEGLGALDEPTLLRALADREPGVRENAIVLCEPRLARAGAASPLAARLIALAEDDSPKVRFQLLATLGSVDSAASRAAQQKLLFRDLDDEWVQLAALSASAEQARAYLEGALAPGSPLIASESEGRAGFLRRAAAAGGSADAEALLIRLASARDASADWWRAALAEGLARGAQDEGGLVLTTRGRSALVSLASDRAPAVRGAALQWLSAASKSTKSGKLPEASRELLSRAEALATNASRPASERADALRLLAIVDPAPRAALFARLVDPREPDEVQVAAVGALGRVPGDDTGKLLLARWTTLRAPVRNEAAEVLLDDPGRTRLLVAALQAGEVQAWALSFWQKRDLIMHRDSEIRALARPLLEEPPAEREKVLKRYEAALAQNGDPARGRAVFDSACARCHRLDGKGGEIGPDLGSVRNRTPSLLLADILAPSRAIAQTYESYSVETTDGETLEGVIVRQTPSALVLRRGDEAERVVRREAIKSLQVSPISAMPADLDQSVDVRQMADLIALLTARP